MRAIILFFSLILAVCSVFAVDEPAVLTIRNPMALMQNCGTYASAITPTCGNIVQALIGSVLMNPQKGTFRVDRPVSFYFVPKTDMQNPFDTVLVWTGKDGINQSSISGPKGSSRLFPEPVGDGRCLFAPTKQSAAIVRAALQKEKAVSADISFRIPSKQCLEGLIGQIDPEDVLLSGFESMELSAFFPKKDLLTICGTIYHASGTIPQLPAEKAMLHCLKSANLFVSVRSFPEIQKYSSTFGVLPADQNILEALQRILSKTAISDTPAATLFSFRLPEKEKQQVRDLLAQKGTPVKENLYQLDKHLYASLSDGCLDLLLSKKMGKKSKGPSGIQDVECSWKEQEFLVIRLRDETDLVRIGHGILQKEGSRVELNIPASALVPLIPPELLPQESLPNFQK